MNQHLLNTFKALYKGSYPNYYLKLVQ